MCLSTRGEMGKLKTFYSANSIKNFLQSEFQDQNIGFVPTMGALHHGHLSLIDRSNEENDITVLSIFVNPKQFNNPEDLEKYPRKIEEDLALLDHYGSQVIVFIPEVDDVYPKDFTSVNIDLGELATTMEGEFRPGHFQGVVDVIYRFYEILHPTRAYFGEKDYQQLAIMRFMVEKCGLEKEVVGCDIIRENSGLASSSRNFRLSEKDKQDALVIYNSLSKAKELAKDHSISEIKEMVKRNFENSTLELEYFEIVHPHTLRFLNEWVPGARACIAAFCNGVRLIDNMQLT